MNWNDQRLALIGQNLQRHRLDALICALPANVLMLSGYWPVVGTAIAIATADGQTVVAAPEDEAELAKRGYASEVISFEAASLDDLRPTAERVKSPLRELLGRLGLLHGRIGLESGEAVEAGAYVSLHCYGNSLAELLKQVAPQCHWVGGDDLIRELKTIHTSAEIARIKASCLIAQKAYHAGALALSEGMTEAEAAAQFRTPLYAVDPVLLDAGRAKGFAYCMFGPNASKAYGAYQRSHGRTIRRGDIGLVHCNSCLNGYWTDVTRTYGVGEIDALGAKMYEAVFAARKAALNALRPGVHAADVDAAARNVLRERGFADAFKHPTGHGVGFAAIDHNAPPRLHPKSPDILREGMVCNIEPGIYLENRGMRHCDMVAITKDGYQLLTPFQKDMSELCLSSSPT